MLSVIRTAIWICEFGIDYVGLHAQYPGGVAVSSSFQWTLLRGSFVVTPCEYFSLISDQQFTLLKGLWECYSIFSVLRECLCIILSSVKSSSVECVCVKISPVNALTRKHRYRTSPWFQGRNTFMLFMPNSVSCSWLSGPAPSVLLLPLWLTSSKMLCCKEQKFDLTASFQWSTPSLTCDSCYSQVFSLNTTAVHSGVFLFLGQLFVSPVNGCGVVEIPLVQQFVKQPCSNSLKCPFASILMLSLYSRRSSSVYFYIPKFTDSPPSD